MDPGKSVSQTAEMAYLLQSLLTTNFLLKSPPWNKGVCEMFVLYSWYFLSCREMAVTVMHLASLHLFATLLHERWSDTVNGFGSGNWIWLDSPLLFESELHPLLFFICSYKNTLHTFHGEQPDLIQHCLCLGGYLC